ncbi:hypothetical protein [Sphingomonas sp. IC081]|uniref:hypothetical protein n=1 Tax=Sphingomonas sp. IC081 TaxID=304378 RepID=UPI0021AF79B5|nr:hypothetical protein [Sphingomonas sp. IC081]
MRMRSSKMRTTRFQARKYLLGAAALVILGAGAAEAESAAARLHTMNVNAPDGSIVQVQYSGEVAPKVEVVPADRVQSAAMPDMADPFAAMDAIAAIMDARMNVMMQQAAMIQAHAARIQQQAAAQDAPSGGSPLVMTGNMTGVMPKGAQVTYYSTSTDANGCTRAVSYSSDGSGSAPKITQAASDRCEAVSPSTRTIPAKVERPAEPPRQAMPATTI